MLVSVQEPSSEEVVGLLQGGHCPWRGMSLPHGAVGPCLQLGELQLFQNSLSETSTSLPACGLWCAIHQPNGEYSVSCSFVCCSKKPLCKRVGAVAVPT